MDIPPIAVLWDGFLYAILIPVAYVIAAHIAARWLAPRWQQFAGAIGGGFAIYVAYLAVEPDQPWPDAGWSGVAIVALGVALVGGAVRQSNVPLQFLARLAAAVIAVYWIIPSYVQGLPARLSLATTFIVSVTLLTSLADFWLSRRPQAARGMALAFAVAGFAAGPLVIMDGSNKIAQVCAASGAMMLSIVVWPHADVLRGVLPAFAVAFFGYLVNAHDGNYGGVPFSAYGLVLLAPFPALLALWPGHGSWLAPTVAALVLAGASLALAAQVFFGSGAAVAVVPTSIAVAVADSSTRRLQSVAENVIRNYYH